MKKCKKQMKEKGITLIALVVTIIVLLILAGITIQIVLQGGVIKQANSAKTLTQIVEIEDVANIIYADLSIQKAQGKIDKISMNDIVSELNKQKYKIETREIGSNNVIGIKANPQKVNIIENGIATIKVNFDISEEKYLYYAVIEGKYYLMKLTNTGVVIEREPKEPDGTVVEQNIEIETGYDTQIVKEIVINENEITLTGGKGEGSTTLVIKYGEYKTDCIVTTAIKARKITAQSITMLEEGSHEIEVVVEPSNAEVLLSYTTTDIDKVTVNNDGIITAKSIGDSRFKQEANVTIKDERTGITTNCIIIIENKEVGKFIEYDVSYVDAYKNYNFTKLNGWRLVNYTKHSDGTFSNIELISTGIPAQLYYFYNKGNSEWFETNATKKNNYKNILRKYRLSFL